MPVSGSGPAVALRWPLRLGYGVVLTLLLPVLLARQWWRGRTLPEFRAHWQERLGFYAPPSAAAREPPGVAGAALHTAPRRIWLHAVSLGETQASLPLLRALRAHWPEAALLLTHMTPTGRAAGAAFAIERLQQAYLPYDAPGAMARFLDHFQPDLGLLMETEVWPGLVLAMRARERPLLLVNARLSARSLRGYQRFAWLAQPSFAGLAACGAQTEADAERLRELGCAPVEVTGNLKFDAVIPAGEEDLARHFRALWGKRPVWLAASTREGEEDLVLDALGALPEAALLVLVPRHPQRFDAVAQLIRQRGLVMQRRSSNAPVAASTRVVLGDSLGELGAYYRSVDLALVGGSLVPLGGQNLLEACARGCPVLIGPHTFNFRLAAEQAVAAGAALRVADAPALGRELARLLADPAARRIMGLAGTTFVAQHRGASARTLDLVARTWAARALRAMDQTSSQASFRS